MAFVVNSYTTLPSPDNALNDEPEGINDAGTIAGFADLATGTVAYTESPAGGVSFLSPPGSHGLDLSQDGGNISQLGITNTGLSFGNASESNPFVPFGWIDDNGSFTVLSLGQYGTEITGMNDLGAVVGLNAVDAQDDTEPFIRSANGTTTPITIQTLHDVVLNGINNSGQMAGYGFTSAGAEEGFFLDGKGNSELVAIPGASLTEPLALNNTGQIVGSYYDTAGNAHGFLFDLATNTYTTLDDPNGSQTVATGINDNSQVVGYYTDAQNHQHGFEALIAHT